MKIYNRYTNEVIWENEKIDTLKDANLGGANLGGANLKGAYLRDANLEGANLPDNFFQFVGFGSRKRCTTFDLLTKKVLCGCFYGSIEEFQEQIIQTHNDNEYAKQYLSIIEMMKGLIENKNER